MDKVQQAKKYLRDEGYFFQLWHINDIIERAKEHKIKLTKSQAKEIAEEVQKETDWEKIDTYILRYK